jgi:hypothetical protein
MKLIPKHIWKEEFHYYSDNTVDGLKSEIQQLFDKTKGLNFSVNLTGEFTFDNEFKMTPKWQLVYIRNFEKDLSYLNGKIFSDEMNRTRVTFTVRPNSVFLIMFFAFLLFGLFELISNNLFKDVYYASIFGVIFILVIPTLMLLFGHLAKQGIKNRFIETFDLRPVM